MSHDIDIIANPGSAYQNEHAQAMQAGLLVHGVSSLIVPSIRHSHNPTAVCWGWRGGIQLRSAGRDVLVMERGYVGDRFKWTSLALNGLNGRGSFPVPPEDGGARFEKYHSELLKPWNPDGGYVLIVGQVHGDAALQGKDLQPWYNQMAAKCKTLGMRCKFRQHPMEVKKLGKRAVAGAEYSTATLEEDLAGAYLVVTFNSNTGVDASLAGKPVVVSDEGSMAGAVAFGNTLDRFGTSEPPDRARWAHALAWCQWSLEEIASGEALAPFLSGAPGSDTLDRAINRALK